MTDTHDNADGLGQLIQTLGDLCHEKYMGCSKARFTGDTKTDFDYSYTDEVINMLDDPRAHVALTHWRDKAVLAALDAIGEPTLQDITVIPTPNEYKRQLEINAWYKNRITKVRAELRHIITGTPSDG